MGGITLCVKKNSVSLRILVMKPWPDRPSSDHARIRDHLQRQPVSLPALHQPRISGAACPAARPLREQCAREPESTSPIPAVPCGCQSTNSHSGRSWSSFAAPAFHTLETRTLEAFNDAATELQRSACTWPMLRPNNRAAFAVRLSIISFSEQPNRPLSYQPPVQRIASRTLGFGQRHFACPKQPARPTRIADPGRGPGYSARASKCIDILCLLNQAITITSGQRLQ